MKDRKTQTITVRMPHELYKKVQKAAEQKGLSMNALIIMQLWAVEK